MDSVMEWISVILTAVFSGGLASFGSLWYAKRKSKAEAVQAESEAAKSWQSVYQELIGELRNSWEEQVKQNHILKGKIQNLEERVTVLQEEVEENARKFTWLLPQTCCVKDCKDRVICDGFDIIKKTTRRNSVKKSNPK